MVRVDVSNANPIPLTLTLSHGEREQSAAGSIVREVRRADTALGCAERQRKILPLPALSGLGEGCSLPRRQKEVVFLDAVVVEDAFGGLVELCGVEDDALQRVTLHKFEDVKAVDRPLQRPLQVG